MATSQEIERNAIADVKAVLDAADINNVVAAHDRQPDAATFVRVACINLRDILDAGTIPSGMKQADMAVEPHSYEADDEDGSALDTLLAACRTAIYDGAIIATLNTASTYHTYYGLQAGDDLSDVEERYRLRSIQFSLIIKPEKT